MPEPTNTPAPVAQPIAPAVQNDLLNAPPGGGNLAAPVVPPVAPPAPVVEPVRLPESKTDGKTVSYDPTGDTGLDLALGFFGKLGLAADSAEITEASKGNFSYIKAKLATLGESAKGWEQYVQLAQDAHTRITDTNTKAYQERLQVAEQTVGGKEAWEAVQAHARANLKPEELVEVRAALDAGGVQTRAMAAYLAMAARAAPDVSLPGAPAVTAAAPAAPVQGLGPLTRPQWDAEYKKGISEFGISGFSKQPQYESLMKRFPG